MVLSASASPRKRATAARTAAASIAGNAKSGPLSLAGAATRVYPQSHGLKVSKKSAMFTIDRFLPGAGNLSADFP